ncbi:MAG: hypothetical protein GF331_27305 [Chitinivibrionales bacterium]|nr:hypothetical protein [Chitinivibrionales bacterium]
MRYRRFHLTWYVLLRATGDGIWADRIERAVLNAGLGAVKKDWNGVQYLSGVNQMIATMASSHIPNSGPDTMAYQPNPGGLVACCAGNAHRIFPNYAMHHYMRTGDGIAVVFYGPSETTCSLGNEGRAVTITQTTDYPFEESIGLRVSTTEPVAFPLMLRLPGWCAEPKLRINGEAVQSPKCTNGFITVKRTFRDGDTLTLELPMQVRMTRWPNGGVALEHGPLVYALCIEEQWTQHIRENYSTSDFPSWAATAATAWNYGLAIDGASEVNLERRPVTTDPWENPPVALRVAARKIGAWKLAESDTPSSRAIQTQEGQFAADGGRELFTPPFPVLPSVHDGGVKNVVPEREFLPKNYEPVAAAPDGDVERITLVPFGATHLRMTVFPHAYRAAMTSCRSTG